MTPRVVLVGLPGAGKSTTGRRLAKILAVEFADSDALVECAAGRTIAEIFATDGEAEFRRIEAATVAEALIDFDGVLALGGGALNLASTREALVRAGVPVVLLRAPLDVLGARVGDGRTRPLLAADPAGRLDELAAQRNPTYQAVATLTVETAHRSPGQIAALVAARLRHRAVR